VPARVSPKCVTIITSVVIVCVTNKDVNPVPGDFIIVLLTVVKAAIVEPVIDGTDIAHHARTGIMVNRVHGCVILTVYIHVPNLTDLVHPVKMDIGVTSATRGAWQIVNHVCQETNVARVTKGTGEIHAHNVTPIVLIRAIRYLVYVIQNVKKGSGEVIATTHAVTAAMASV